MVDWSPEISVFGNADRFRLSGESATNSMVSCVVGPFVSGTAPSEVPVAVMVDCPANTESISTLATPPVVVALPALSVPRSAVNSIVEPSGTAPPPCCH